MLAAGDILGRYTLLKRLASGGMGEIFLAARVGPIGFAPPVALKVLRDELATDRQFVEMLVDEAKISMFLNHQNVVSVLDFGEHQGRYFIAMEYVQGVTLKDLLDALKARGRRLDLSTALHVTTELCRALKYAHTRTNHAGEPLAIVHRDVTPGNVLLSIQGEVKLTDFGIARAKNRIHTTQAGVLKGKFGYMAPEMLRYEQLDARADLFCAGIILYEMVTGRHPVEGAAIMEAVTRLEEKDFPSPRALAPSLPAPLEALILKALEPQPAERWATAAALSSAMQDIVLADAELRREARSGAVRLAALIAELFPQMLEPPLPTEQAERLLRVARERSDPLLFAAPPEDPAARIAEIEGALVEARREAEALADTGPGADGSEATDDGQLGHAPYAGSSPALHPPSVSEPELDTAEHDRDELLRGAGLEPRRVHGKTGGWAANAASAAGLVDAGAATTGAPALGSSLGPGPVPGPLASALVGRRVPPASGVPARASASSVRTHEPSTEPDPSVRVGDSSTRAFSLEGFGPSPEFEIQFPDSSTDPRHRRDWLAEPELPIDATAPLSAISRADIERAHLDERTIAGSGLAHAPTVDDSKTVSLPTQPSDEWGAEAPSEVMVFDPPTAVAESIRHYDEGEIDRAPVERVSSYDDGATAFEGPPVEAFQSSAPAPRFVSRGGPSVDDVPTQIPEVARDDTLLQGLSSVEPVQAKAEARANARTPGSTPRTPGSSRTPAAPFASRTPAAPFASRTPAAPFASRTPAVPFASRTSGASLAATARAPAALGGHTGVGISPTGSGAAPIAHPGASPPSERVDDLEAVAATRVRGEALVDDAFDLENSLGSSPKPLEGPLRVKVEAPSDLDGFELPAPSRGPGRGAGIVTGLARGPSNAPDLRTPVTDGSGGIGNQTGRWMRGELPTNNLSWGDEAAARRAIATRHLVGGASAAPDPRAANAPATDQRAAHSSAPDPRGGSTARVDAGSFLAGLGTRAPQTAQPSAQGNVPAPASYGAPPSYGAPQLHAQGATPQATQAGAMLPGADVLAPYAQGSTYPQGAPPWSPQAVRPSGAGSSWALPVAVGFVVLALGLVVFAAFFTHATWPEVTFETTPPGATLVIDGKPRARDGKVVVTPVLVRVQPNVAHAIELRLAGHVTRRIEPKVELGYLGSRTYSFTLERQSYRVAVGPVPGKVSVNGQPVGEGTEVELGAMPGDGPITLRVEAAGHVPFEYRFASARDLQPVTDVALRPEPPPAPAPSPNLPPRRR